MGALYHSDPQKRSDLKSSRFATRELMQRIIRDVPRPEKPRVGSYLGSKGWKIVKFHALAYIEHWTQKFGRAKCFDSSSNENNYKELVKHNVKLTQRISSKFATQLANNDYDRIVIERVYDYIHPYCSKIHKESTEVAVTAIGAAALE
jgi:uncharacterized protein YjlB